MIPNNGIKFEAFVAYFPEIELPIVLTDKSVKEFSKYNDPFNTRIIDTFLSEWEKDIDEFTEFIPGFKIPETGEFIALVYYKANLTQFGFYIVTFTLRGDFISVKPLNNMRFSEGIIENSAAIIDEDWRIKIVAGQQEIQAVDYNPEDSKVATLEILPTGDIVHTLANR